MATLRKEIKDALIEDDLDRIAAMAPGNKRVFGAIMALTYDKENVIAWRAIEAMGLAVATIAADNPGMARDIVRRLLWSVTEESGSIGWSAPEMLAEVVAQSPGQFSDLPPIIMSLSEEPPFLPGVLWAMGRLAEAGLSLPRDARAVITASLAAAEPGVRGMALWAASRARFPGIGQRVEAMGADRGSFRLYRNRALESVAIGDLARQVSGDLQAK